MPLCETQVDEPPDRLQAAQWALSLSHVSSACDAAPLTTPFARTEDTDTPAESRMGAAACRSSAEPSASAEFPCSSGSGEHCECQLRAMLQLPSQIPV